jgi:hypothetical protein
MESPRTAGRQPTSSSVTIAIEPIREIIARPPRAD